MNQYVHLLTNTGVGLPTDLWVPATDVLKPQNSWQIAGGFAKDFIDKEVLLSIEGYYKESKNVISYKEGASFLEVTDDASSDQTDDFNWEQNITSGKGWSYGAEFLLQKKSGQFSGWIGYTLSWTQLQFDELNFGKKFWARYDRRHDISLVGIWKIREQKDNKNGITLSGTWVYGTGNAITMPIAEYNSPIHNPGRPQFNGFFGNNVSQYTGRGEFRMAPYHRMDIGLRVTRKFDKYERTFEFSIYNIYNRLNPFFYYIGYEDSMGLSLGKRVLRQVSLFPLIPSISYHIKF
jgi:hypothetical protein